MIRNIYFGSIAVCFVLFPLAFPTAASAFDQRLSPWVGRCAQGGCGGGGGGGYVAPPPSPAEIAAAQASAVNNEGLNAENAGNWTLAASLYEQALRINPSDPVIANNLNMARAHLLNDAGIEAGNAGNSDLAVSLYEQALRMSPNDAVIANNLRMARATAERIALQRAAEQRAADEKRNAARRLISSHVLAAAEAKRSAARELISSHVLVAADARRIAAREQIANASTTKQLLQTSAQSRAQIEIQGLQEALRRLKHSIDLDANSREEWEKTSADALRDSYALLSHSVVDGLAAGVQRQIDAQDKELGRVGDQLYGELDPTRRQGLHTAFGTLKNRKEELLELKDRVGEADRAIEILDDAQKGAYDKKERESKSLIEKAWEDCDKLGLLPKGAGQAKAIVDASYDIWAQVFSMQHIKTLDANAKSDLDAVAVLSKKMDALIKLKKTQALEQQVRQQSQ